MKTLITMVCVLALMLCTVAQAQESTEEAQVVTATMTSASTTCTKGNLSRVVEITYAGEQGKAPCEVHYKKVTEDPNHDQVLYDAQHKSGYCEEKKREFVEKLKGWGWDCK